MSLHHPIQRLWRAVQDFSLNPLGSNIVGALIIGLASTLFFVVKDQGLYIKVAAVTLLIVGLVMVVRKYLYPTKTLIFVSSGGTCRDPMAKAIATKLLTAKKPEARINILAAALNAPSKQSASYAARTIIAELYKEDLLEHHKPQQLTEQMAKDADLILVMDQSLLREGKTYLPGWPKAYPGKVYLLKEFFGSNGDVIDPWPDGKDQATLKRYRNCAKEIQEVMSVDIDRLLVALDTQLG